MGGRGFDGRSIPGGGGRIPPRTAGLPPAAAALKLEQHAHDLDRSVRELSSFTESSSARAARLEAAAPRVIRAVALADATNVAVTHGLTAKPSLVSTSAPRRQDKTALIGATGRVTLIPSDAATVEYDEAKQVYLRADGWGTTIVVDVLVIP